MRRESKAARSELVGWAAEGNKLDPESAMDKDATLNSLHSI